MRSLAYLLSGSALLHAAVAQDAFLFTIDRSVVSSSTAMIDSDLASAIIARRRALTADRHLATANAGMLEDINIYGGYQTPMFGDARAGDAPGKLFIRISGADLSISDFDSAMPNLWIQGATKDLLTDFKAGVEHRRKDGICEYAVPPSRNAPRSEGIEVVFSYPLEDEPSCLSPSEIPEIPVILSLYGYLPTKPAEVKARLGSLIRVLRHLSVSENVESTLVLLPSKLAKPHSHASHHLHARAAQASEEEPLDAPTATLQALDNLGAAPAKSHDNFTLPAVIPACFTSQSLCENTTNSCSGHGSCYKAHANCFKCRCSSTLVRTNADGTKKTVQWGGAACQKKDVSVPFVLFASFGVVMAALIAGAIGMLFNMGNQELPSVIGAGVAGTRPGK